MAAGIHAAGDQATVFDERDWPTLEGGLHLSPYEHVVFYGLEGNLPAVFNHYATRRRAAIYVDLGYWGRREGGRWTGFHKIVVNARHPVGYYRKPKHPADRVGRFDLDIKPWRKDGRHILLAGMGDKGAYAEGFKPEEWERDAIAEIRMATDRPILYRAKPSWKTAKRIPGTDWSDPTTPVTQELENCWAVVTHHSNVAIDGILAGVPAFCWGGVAREMSGQHLSRIEDPYFPPHREQWTNDIAYTQWSIAEMRAGAPWRHLKSEGLI